MTVTIESVCDLQSNSLRTANILVSSRETIMINICPLVISSLNYMGLLIIICIGLNLLSIFLFCLLKKSVKE